MKRPEILAPAGNMECLKAAILAGADAIYLGGYMFGARAFSNNFSNDEIREAVIYAHKYGVRIYVTVNTLIYDNEVERFMEYIDFLYNNNVDAVIMQDIGMVDLVRQTYPDFDVHASTQMHIHNQEGVAFAEKMGLTRAVLARETTIEDIKKIKENSNIELEIFVHGALCVSYSGQCLMSSIIGGRSGNRGTCAGSCRLAYDILNENKAKVNKEKYNLSTKDLNCLENIDQLIDIGVDSLKIEGRMKSSSYVYMVVSLYKKAIETYIKNGKVEIDENDLIDLKKTFNRLFTKGFIFHESNNNFINPFRPNHQGIDIGRVVGIKNNSIQIKLSDYLNMNDGIRVIGNDDFGTIVTYITKNGRKVDSANKNDIVEINFKDTKRIKINSIVKKTLDYKLNKKIENDIKTVCKRVLIQGEFRINSDNKMMLSVFDGKNSISVISANSVEKALNRPTTIEEIKKSIKKTGNTIYDFEKINVFIKEEYFASIKEINDLRRRALEELDQARLKMNRTYIKNKYDRKIPSYEHVFKKNIYVSNIEQYTKIKKYDFDSIYMDELTYNRVNDNRKILKLPRVINHFCEYDKQLLVGELGSVNNYSNTITDFSLNVVNSYSVALLHSCGVDRITLSYEINDEQLELMLNNYKKRYLALPNLELIIYGKEELMISKFDLLSYYKINNKGYLKDRFNNLYPIICKDNLMYIYNYKARHLDELDYYNKIGINYIRYNILDKEDLNMIV